jgi:ADP-heptose:LPS heptosyltransferase
MLFQRPTGIGDIICTFPSVLALRQKYPNAVIVYSVRKAFKSIVRMGHIADLIVESDWSSDVPKVQKSDYDLFFQPFLEDERPLNREHVHLVYDIARSLGVIPESTQPKIYVPPSVTRFVHERLLSYRRHKKYLFGIHLGPSWPVREWTVENWTKLVAVLHAQFDCTVLQLGSEDHTSKGITKVSRIPQTEDWVGKFDLEQSVAVLEQLDLFIGIDSGLLHAAGATGTPSVGLFGAIDPKLRLPLQTPSIGVTSQVPCLGCHHRLPRLHWETGCPYDIRCMTDLSVDDVFIACQKILCESTSA